MFAVMQRKFITRWQHVTGFLLRSTNSSASWDVEASLSVSWLIVSAEKCGFLSHSETYKQDHQSGLLPLCVVWICPSCRRRRSSTQSNEHIQTEPQTLGCPVRQKCEKKWFRYKRAENNVKDIGLLLGGWLFGKMCHRFPVWPKAHGVYLLLLTKKKHLLSFII